MLHDFRIEAEELFDEAEDALLSIEKSDDFLGCFNSVFRAFHSVKGAAGMFGIENLQQHMHYVESLLESKKENGELSSIIIDYFLASIDVGRKILKGESPRFDYYDPDSSPKPQSSAAPAQEGQEASVSTVVEDDVFRQHVIEQVKKRAQKKSSSGHIVVVDDERDLLSLLKEILESQNYTVDCFDNAKDALVALKQVDADAVITDINMPEMNGIEFMNQLHKFRPWVPILVVSGYVTKDVCINAMACGVAGILEKPFNQEQLLSMCQVYVTKHKSYRLLNKSIDLLVYQFEALKDNKFSETDREIFKKELIEVLKQKKVLFENLL